MGKMVMLSATKAKILEDSRKLLGDKGVVFVDVVTKKEIVNIQELVAIFGETNIGVYDSKNETMIGTLLIGNSTYNKVLAPPKIIWTLRLCSALNEKSALIVRSIIERTGSMIMVKIISVIY